jgi:predicted DNA-binding transcriptional regulator AlpA
VTPPNVAGLEETAELLGISRERIRQLRAAGRLPEPRQLASGPVWDRAEIEAFRQDRIADGRRVAGKHSMCLQRWRETRNVSAVARSCGISRATVRRWLEDMGEPVTDDREEP